MKKRYVLDTNVILSDPSSITAFKENDVIIPMTVLEELDRHKGRQDDVGKHAREANRLLDDLRKKGSLLTGVELPGGGDLRVMTPDKVTVENLPVGLMLDKPDNAIIALAWVLSQSDDSVVLVSRDINVRVKSDALGINSEDYRRIRVVDDVKKFYHGVEVIEVEEPVLDAFYASGFVQLPATTLGNKTLYPNEIVVAKTVQNGQTVKSALARHTADNVILPIAKIESAFGLKPLNKEQAFSLDLLFDESIKLVTLVGGAGVGKTLIALAAALEQLKGVGTMPRYDKLIVMKPVQPVGRDIGFLPGTVDEKMEPWIAPIKDNLAFLFNTRRPRGSRKNHHAAQQNVVGSIHGSDFKQKFNNEDPYLSIMRERGLIEVEALTFIRGRSIPNAFILVDEGQNLTTHELKTIVTRVGEGTKVVITGDLEQVDVAHLDAYSNGLAVAVERFKDQSIAAHVTMLKGERSELATIASKIL